MQKHDRGWMASGILKTDSALKEKDIITARAFTVLRKHHVPIDGDEEEETFYLE
jgi:hypothetical protein